MGRNMIATLRGTITEKQSEIVIIEAGNVGYGVLLPLEDYVTAAPGEAIKVYVYEHIRENSHDLYAFTRAETKLLFEQLVDVNGVGPKMALNILSVGDAREVRRAIASGDIKLLTAAPGVGKRVAERVVVELKDKVGLVATPDADKIFLSGAAVDKDEAVQALVALGYTVTDAISALSGIDEALATEDRIRQALKATR